jgi:Domain of unknown function (DUF5056)
VDEQLQEDWLEARLRQEMPYIDDEGFTAQVVQKLPTPGSRRSFRATILVCVTLLASIVTYFVSDGGRFLVTAVYRLASMPVLFVGLVAICCTLVMTAIAAGAALSNVNERR